MTARVRWLFAVGAFLSAVAGRADCGSLMDVNARGFDTTSGIPILTWNAADSIASHESDTLNLTGWKNLTQRAAERLAAFQGRVLILNSLTSIQSSDTGTSAALAGFKGGYRGAELHLDGLQSLGDADAVRVADFCDVYRGLYELCRKSYSQNLDDVERERMRLMLPSMIRTQLSLNGLNGISSRTATMLANVSVYTLSLNGIDSLPVGVAAGLSHFKGRFLHLGGVQYLTDSAISALSHYAGYVYFDSLNSTSQHKWNAVRGTPSPAIVPDPYFRYFLNIRPCALEIHALTDSQAEYIAGFTTQVIWHMLDGITDVTVKQAGILASTRNRGLYLDGLTGASLAVLKQLTKFRGDLLSLSGLKTLDNAQASILARFGGQFIILNGLQSISDSTLMSLLEFDGTQVDLKGIEKWSESQMQIITAANVTVGVKAGK